MKEAFGGGFMLKLLLIFIIIYVSLMAVAIKYAKTYRLKNYVINLVEQYQYSGATDAETINKITSDLNGRNIEKYNQAIMADCLNNQKVTGGDSTLVGGYAVCIASRGDNIDTRYYKVVTYVSIELPFFVINWTIPISGETSIISKK